MLTLLAAIALSQIATPPRPPIADDCDEKQGCVRAGPAQMFALADKLYEEGNVAGAEQILEALTQDIHPQFRAEARFRLAALREKAGNLEGAAEALRALLAEQPTANPARLELARILGRLGKKKEARGELAKAEALGLPAEVQQNVRRFASSLQTAKRRGVSLELSSGPDSNINRSTSSQYVDTIIAPFELDPDARRQSGVGFTIGGQAFTRNRLGGSVDLLSRAGAHADLFTKRRFNDIQLTAETGPEWTGRFGQVRPAILHERRWYGGKLYSTGFGASLNWLIGLGAETQLELNGSRVRQDIKTNHGQDGWRTSIGADLSRSLGPGAGARFGLRYAAVDAKVRAESLRQIGGSLFLARRFDFATLFGQVDYTRTRGLEPLFLFGKTRRDDRLDLTAGAVLNRVVIGGFSPLVRVTHSNSDANISIYDYRRTRLDLGVSRSF